MAAACAAISLALTLKEDPLLSLFEANRKIVSHVTPRVALAAGGPSFAPGLRQAAEGEEVANGMRGPL